MYENSKKCPLQPYRFRLHAFEKSMFLKTDEIYSLIVVGGGPCGSMAAKYALKHGIKSVLVLEEHASIGSPVQCTGIVSVSAYKEAEIENKNCVLEEFSGARVYAPGGGILEILGKKVMAYSISRKKFDQTIAENAAHLGAIYKLKTKCIGIERKNNVTEVYVIERGIPKILKSNIVIAADGVQSTVAKSAGFEMYKKLLPSYQAEMEIPRIKKGYVDIFIGSLTPGFFGWSVPISENISRVGMAYDRDCVDAQPQKNSLYYMDALVKKINEKSGMTKQSVMEVNYGGIPMGVMKKTYGEGIMIVGDAAGQCKPISGGGIKTGLCASKIAGKIAAEAALNQDYSEKMMGKYETAWKKDLGKELDFGMKFHKFRNTLTEEDMDTLIESLNKPDILKIISEYGDMDNPSIVLKKLIFSKHAFKALKTVPRLTELLIKQ